MYFGGVISLDGHRLQREENATEYHTEGLLLVPDLVGFTPSTLRDSYDPISKHTLRIVWIVQLGLHRRVLKQPAWVWLM